jgi:lipopolysaccharide biosynthesis glycosyltransferase
MMVHHMNEATLNGRMFCLDAYKAYKDGDYCKALILYSRLANKIGHRFYHANTTLCLSRLNHDESSYTSLLKAFKADKFDLLSEFFSFVSECIIVSLTSYPARIGTVHITIKSLLEQNCKPNKLILWLAEEQFPSGENELPSDLLKMKEYGLAIKWCRDIKSYKKLIPSLLEYPDKVIVTADDDVIYNKNWLLQLAVAHVAAPSHIVCHRGHRVLFDKEGNIESYRNWPQEINDEIASYSIFFTGSGGVLYPPRSLHESVTDAELFTEICPHGDDIWFWGMALLNNTKIQRVIESDFYLDLIPESQENALWIDNVRNRNDKMLESLVKNYPEIRHRLLQGDVSLYKSEVIVSIIVPVYNTGEDLSTCLDSLLRQSFKGIEILCIDDGSTDSLTIGILRAYSDKYKSVHIIRQTNSGPATARNTGLDHAKGRYIAFVDSDDYISVRYIESLCISAIIHNANIAVANQILCVPENGNSWEKNSGYENIHDLSDKQIAAKAILTTGITWNKLYKKDYLLRHNIKFLDGMRCQAEDNYFSVFANIYACGTVCIANDATYYWRQHNKSITKNISTSTLNSSATVYREIQRRIMNSEFLDKTYWYNVVTRRAIKDLKYSLEKIENIKKNHNDILNAFNAKIDVCCIADENYITPTLVFLESMRRSKLENEYISAYVLVPKKSKNKMMVLEQISSDDFVVEIIEIATDQFESLHKYEVEDNYCMASPSAMFKFIIPEIFPDLDRILYIDADLIVRKDLLNLFMKDMENEYLCAVVDMWAPITNREEVKKVEKYFNSGVMLMNLAKMREDRVSDKLIRAKTKTTNFNLMDQDVFNEVCAGHVRLLDIKYNFLPVCYKRHKHKFDIDIMNDIYGSKYRNIDEIALDPTIVHWAGSDKPWVSNNTLFSDEWVRIYSDLVEAGLLVDGCLLMKSTFNERLKKDRPLQMKADLKEISEK